MQPVGAASQDLLRQQAIDVMGGNDGFEWQFPVSGGDIHQAWAARLGDKRLFIKLNAASHFDTLAGEAHDLVALADARSLRVPRVLFHGRSPDHAWLVLEFLDFKPPAADSAEQLGRGLAGLHARHNDRHGWTRNNHIGTTPQRNDWQANWVDFWREQRMEPQVRLAIDRGAPVELERRWSTLSLQLDERLGHRPAASLLHGDLWGGNQACLAGGEPVVFDPASHFGDAECDLAMMNLFGGFEPRVFEAYDETRQAPPGREERQPLYQLYHLLNHFNLFGSGWWTRVSGAMDRLGV